MLCKGGGGALQALQALQTLQALQGLGCAGCGGDAQKSDSSREVFRLKFSPDSQAGLRR